MAALQKGCVAKKNYISGVKFGLVETPEREVFLSCYVTLWEGKVQVAIRVCQKYFSVHNLGVP